ncbi:hypothetical protein LC608_19075 [Nostoc sp. XA010]|uniref:hypothetical protein n=1 Tax=Nostoc sp. XA010 TaxID=2780407 RepID=UPI001E3E1667|nr:hypothetical protein [Nostoc sp. XA010]MCC5659039.1 hypothetical protein [Nostoc sp. XA010]
MKLVSYAEPLSDRSSHHSSINWLCRYLALWHFTDTNFTNFQSATVFDLSLIFAIHPTAHFCLLSTASLVWLLQQPKPLTFFPNNDILAHHIAGRSRQKKI